MGRAQGRAYGGLPLAQAYRRRALETHPDKVAHVAPGTAGVVQFEEVQAAYALLKDDGTRRLYDLKQGLGRAASASANLRTPKQYTGPSRCPPNRRPYALEMGSV